MGLTFNCAQCHDHKYDAFTQEEFFRLFAFFNQTEDNDQADDRPSLPIYTEEQKKQKKDWEDELVTLQATLDRPTPALEESRRQWEAALPSRGLKAEGRAGPESGCLPRRAKRMTPAVERSSHVAAFRLEPEAPFAVSKISLSTASGDAKAPKARFVRFELPGKQRVLHLAEVQVFSGAENVALKGKSKQSSTAFGGDAKRANDGNTNGDYNANSVCHTDTQDNPWWEVDLGSMMPVDRVVIWNRTDGGDGISSRMKIYKFSLLDEARKPVDEKKSDAFPNPKTEYPFDGVRDIPLKAVGPIHVPDKVLAVGQDTLFVFARPRGRGKFRLQATDDVGPAGRPRSRPTCWRSQRPEAERTR